jgi:hypothetical protein
MWPEKLYYFISKNVIAIFSFLKKFWAVLGFELMLARQVFYHLSYTPSPFVLVLILKEGLITTLPGLASNLRSSCLYFLSIWDYRHEPLCLAFVLFLRPESH